MKYQWKKITLLAATIFWMIASFDVAHAETSLEEKLDTAIELMRKAVEEAEKGNWILGDPMTVCPGYEIPVPYPKDVHHCDIPAYSCRCF